MKKIGNYWYPDADMLTHKDQPARVRDLDRAIKHCKQKRVAIQAGGCVGMWANYLSKHFDQVWTFEPDLENYRCMVLNATADNIIMIHAALGYECGFAALDRHQPDRVGTHRLVEGNEFVVTTIDDLPLEHCDMIVLDTEGTERFILEGTQGTLADHRPILMVEDNGLSEHYCVKSGWPDEYPGYRVVDRIARDVVMVPV